MNRLTSVGVLLIGLAAIGWMMLRWSEHISKEQRQRWIDRQMVLGQNEKVAVEEQMRQETAEAQRGLQLIRQNCNSWAVQVAREHQKQILAALGSTQQSDFYSTNDYEKAYRECLRSNGLE